MLFEKSKGIHHIFWFFSRPYLTVSIIILSYKKFGNAPVKQFYASALPNYFVPMTSTTVNSSIAESDMRRRS